MQIHDPNFDKLLGIPAEKQPTAYLSLLIHNLATMRALQMQLADLQCAVDSSRIPLETIEYYQKLADEIVAELRVYALAKWGE